MMKDLKVKISDDDCFSLIECFVMYYWKKFIEYDEIFYEVKLELPIRLIISLIDIVDCSLCSLLLYFNFFSALSVVINWYQSPLPNIHRAVISGESWRLMI